MLALLRRYTLAWHCWGGTQFSGAKLSHTDFTEADLTAARFAGDEALGKQLLVGELDRSGADTA